MTLLSYHLVTNLLTAAPCAATADRSIPKVLDSPFIAVSSSAFNSRSIRTQTPWNNADHRRAKPQKNQQDIKPALTYEPGGRTFESCRAHQINNLQPRNFESRSISFNSGPGVPHRG